MHRSRAPSSPRGTSNRILRQILKGKKSAVQTCALSDCYIISSTKSIGISLTPLLTNSAPKCPKKIHPIQSKPWASRTSRCQESSGPAARDLEEAAATPRQRSSRRSEERVSTVLPLVRPGGEVGDPTVCAIHKEKFPFGQRPPLPRPSGKNKSGFSRTN